MNNLKYKLSSEEGEKPLAGILPQRRKKMGQATMKLEPNLQTFTEEEIDDILGKIAECHRNKDKAEARRLTHLLPLRPGTANILKNDIGIQAMIAEGCNLSEAVREFGHEWLYS